ncbi:hypothetical protein [Streptomyces boluensis]|uniref:Integral-membrane protein n=1 Tax=Streptomyces boluensis TaxID=1775135 RepID=A0A964UYE9_9ACTN|nr:hypothetical protein [Streptomyces boluensis]NBE56540.1 hypothetical protein [Streptomyces boluensis]
MTDVRSPLRAFRAALFAAVGVPLAAVGHSSMSGRDLPFGALLLAFAVTAVVAWCVGHRRRGVPSLATGLLGMQAALHLAFSGAQAHAGPPRGPTGTAGGPMRTGDPMGPGSSMAAGGPTGADAAMGHGGPTAYGNVTSYGDAAYGGGAEHGAALAGHGASMGHNSLGMLAVHLLAALVCALWLARGEAAFLQLLAAVDSLAFAPLRLLLAVVRPPARCPAARRPRPRPTARPRTAVLAYTVSRRGPPRAYVPFRHAPMAP